MSCGEGWQQPGLKALWHLEDVNDSSGNSYTLTNQGTVTFALGKFHNCAILGNPNSSKNLTIQQDLSVDLSNTGITMAGWFYIQALPTSGVQAYLMEWRSATGTGRYQIVRLNNIGGTQYIEFYCCGTAIQKAITLDLNKWYYIVVTSPATAGQTGYLYINGVVVASGVKGTTANTDHFIYLGGTTSVYLSGNIDEVQYYNVEKSAVWVRNQYRRAKFGE